MRSRGNGLELVGMYRSDGDVGVGVERKGNISLLVLISHTIVGFTRPDDEAPNS